MQLFFGTIDFSAIVLVTIDSSAIIFGTIDFSAIIVLIKIDSSAIVINYLLSTGQLYCTGVVIGYAYVIFVN